MKVIIINPPVVGDDKYIREGRCEQRASSFQYLMVPISLPSIAGLLRENKFDVKVLDCIAEDLGFTGALKVIKQYNPKLIVINYSTVTYEGDKKFSAMVRRGLPGAHLTAIGVHVTTMTEQALTETALNSIIRNEPEETALELAQAIEKGRKTERQKNRKAETDQKLKKIKGLSYRSKSKVIDNPDRPFIENLDALPFPARDLLHNEKYKMPVYNRPYTLVVTSRGCPNNCSFCTAKIYYGSKIRMRSPENILDEVEEIIKVQKIKDISFWADTFTFVKRHVMELCAGIKKRNLQFRWMCNARVDRIDPEMLKAMKGAGCQVIAFGVESGNQKILNSIGKNITLKEIRQAYKWVRKADIESAAHIIFGLPGETEGTIRQTIKFVKEINPDYVQFYSAIPFPGTRFRKEAEQKGWITSDKWSDYELGKNIISTPKLPVERLAYWRKRAYREFYLRPWYIWGRLKNFVKKPSDIGPFFRQGISFLKDWAGNN